MCPKKLNSVTYKKSMLDSAVEAVMSGTFTMKQSASVYGVPVASISNSLRKKGYNNRKKKDVDQLFQIDKQLIDWLQLMAGISCFSLRNQMADIINEVFERFGQKVKLDGKSGQMQWIDRFVERQPEVLKASLEAESVVTGISSEHIDEWTRKLTSHLLHAHNIEVQEFCQQSNAANIFCCFEVGSVYFSGNKRSFRFLYKPSQGHVDGEFIMSFYSCICADGTFLKPVAIVKDETLIQTTMETGVRDFHILSSSEGKMSCEAAMLWMQLIEVEIQPKKGHTSFLIFLDQTIRPLSLATLDFCRQRELILFYLPGHYPNMKLPFGMDIFYHLNGEYDSILSSDEEKDREVTVESALELLMEAWKMMLKTNSNVTEFHDFGLVPLDSSVMKSTVEEIVPLTMSPTKGALEAQDGAETPASSAHVPHTPNMDASSSSCLPNASQNSNDDIAHNLPPVRPTRIPPKNYKESSETDNETEETVEGNSAHTRITVPTSANVVPGHSASSKKTNLKMKIKRSDRIPNTFSVQSDATLPTKEPENCHNDGLSGRKCSSENAASCDQCDKARDHGLRSGVVQGLVFALKRIESSLRADTLNLYKSRYLSPYLNDHRPSEPSFFMWCELMKCLEMGPDAVQKDFLLARSIQNSSSLRTHSSECGSTNSCKSGSCLSDAPISDAAVLPHCTSRNKKRTRSPSLQQSAPLGVVSQNVLVRTNSSAIQNTSSGNTLSQLNSSDLSKTNKHDIHSVQTEQKQSIGDGGTFEVAERDMVDFNNNDHLSNPVNYPYKAYTHASNSDPKNSGRESFRNNHPATEFSCNNQQELLYGPSVPVHREGMSNLGHRLMPEQKLESHSLQLQFRPPRIAPSQATISPHQRSQFEHRGSTIFHQHSQLPTPAGLSMQHQQFQRSQQSQQNPYPLVTKTGQPQKGWIPAQASEPQEAYASASQQQRLLLQQRRDLSNASMQSKYDYQTDSSGVSSMAVYSENSTLASQTAGNLSQDIVVDDPVAQPCISKMPGNRSVQQSCTPKKNPTSLHVTSTPKSADSQLVHVTQTPTSAPQVPRPQSIESAQHANNLKGTVHLDTGSAHFHANLQQHSRPLPTQYERDDHSTVSNNQSGFPYSRSGHPSRTATMPPPMNLSSSAHNLTEDGSSHHHVRASEEQKHPASGVRQENVPRYPTNLSGIQTGDFNRSGYYPFSGHNHGSLSSIQGSSHHPHIPNSCGPNATHQSSSSYNQAGAQTGVYPNGFHPNSNEQSHSSDFHSAYHFTAIQQQHPSPHQQQHHQNHMQQAAQMQHMQQQQLSQSQQHQHLQSSSNGQHMSGSGHSRAVDGGHGSSDVKIEQYTNL